MAGPTIAVVTKNRTNPAYGGALIGAGNAAAWDKPYERRDCASWQAVVSDR
jgi:hypothetical protein